MLRGGGAITTGDANGEAGALDRLAAAFDEVVADGTPAALVVRRGDDVLLARAAGTDRDGRAFTPDRPVFLYSAVKPLAALAVLVAAADGALDLDAPVASAWPAFGAHGKGEVTVAQALAHAAAVPGWTTPVSGADLLDREAAAEALASSPPWWPPGEPGEHAVSYGHLLDGILRHATGEDVVAWTDRAIAAVGTRSLSLGAGTGEDAPAPLDDPGGAWQAAWLEAPGLMGDLLRNPAELLDVDWVNGPQGRALVAPAVTGYGSAHDLAELWAWWTGPGAAARLGRDLRDRSLSAVVAGHDHVLDREVAWGLGPQVDDTSHGMGGVGGVRRVVRGPAGVEHRPGHPARRPDGPVRPDRRGAAGRHGLTAGTTGPSRPPYAHRPWTSSRPTGPATTSSWSSTSTTGSRSPRRSCRPCATAGPASGPTA